MKNVLRLKLATTGLVFFISTFLSLHADAQLNGANLIAAAGNYSATSSGSYIDVRNRTLNISAADVISYDMTGKPYIEHIAVTINYRMKENTVVLRDVTMILAFEPGSKNFRKQIGDGKMISDNEIVFEEFWHDGGQIAKQDDSFVIGSNAVLLIEKLFDEKGQQVIYKNDFSLIKK